MAAEDSTQNRFWSWVNSHPLPALALVVAVVWGCWYGYGRLTATDPPGTASATIRSTVHMTAERPPFARATLPVGELVTVVCADGGLYGVLTDDDRYVRITHVALDQLPTNKLAPCEQEDKSIAPHTTYDTRVFIEDYYDEVEQRWVPFTELDPVPEDGTYP